MVGNRILGMRCEGCRKVVPATAGAVCPSGEPHNLDGTPMHPDTIRYAKHWRIGRWADYDGCGCGTSNSGVLCPRRRVAVSIGPLLLMAAGATLVLFGVLLMGMR